MFFSLIIATYNSCKSIEDCLNSIIQQEFKSFEIIIKDNNSKDDTVKIIKNLFQKKNFDKFNIIVSDDGSVYEAWNIAIKKTKGEYIMFLGSDDFLNKNALKEYYNYVKNNNMPIYTYCKAHKINSKDIIVNTIGSQFDEKLFKSYMCVVHTGSIHHRKIFNLYGFFDSDYKIAGDYEFLLRFYKHEKIFISTHNEETYWHVDETNVDITFKSNWTFEEQQFNNKLISFNSAKTPIILGSLYLNENLDIIGLGVIDEKTNDHLAISVTDLMSYFSFILSQEEEKEAPPSSNESDEFLECQDSNDSGYLDVCYLDNNENSIIDSILVDENEDGIDDVLYVDANENDIYEVKVILPEGYFEYDYTVYLLDENEDETYDFIGHDYDNDQEIDEYEEIT